MKNTRFTTPQDAEAAFYEAFEQADLDRMMAVWAEDENILCIHPSGPRLIGPDQIRESWRQIFRGGPTLRFHLTNQQIVRGSVISVHSLHENIEVVGENKSMQPVIATNIYLLTEKGWRMLVHHASPSPAAPGTIKEQIPPILH